MKKFILVFLTVCFGTAQADVFELADQLKSERYRSGNLTGFQWIKVVKTSRGENLDPENLAYNVQFELCTYQSNSYFICKQLGKKKYYSLNHIWRKQVSSYFKASGKVAPFAATTVVVALGSGYVGAATTAFLMSTISLDGTAAMLGLILGAGAGAGTGSTVFFKAIDQFEVINPMHNIREARLIDMILKDQQYFVSDVGNFAQQLEDFLD